MKRLSILFSSGRRRFGEGAPGVGAVPGGRVVPIVFPVAAVLVLAAAWIGWLCAGRDAAAFGVAAGGARVAAGCPGAPGGHACQAAGVGACRADGVRGNAGGHGGRGGIPAVCHIQPSGGYALLFRHVGGVCSWRWSRKIFFWKIARCATCNGRVFR